MEGVAMKKLLICLLFVFAASAWGQGAPPVPPPTLTDSGTFNDSEGFGVAAGKEGFGNLKVKGFIEGSNTTITKSGDSALIITTGAGGTTAYDDISDPDASGSIAFAAYTGTYTSATDEWGGLIISHTLNANIGATNLLTLAYAADGDGQGMFFKCTDNEGDTKFTIGANGNLITWGSITATGAISATGTISSADGFDAVGAVDLDYGSADVTDHTFVTNGTGTAEIVFPSGAIDGTEILDQTIKGDDVDSTGENFVFDGAYHVTSATSDSAYITIETLEDTAALRLLLAGGEMSGNITMSGAETVDGKDVSTLTDLGQTIEYTEFTATTSANWQTLVSDETGTGAWVFGTTPTLTTGVDINLAATDNVTIDARTNNRTVTVGALRLNHTPQGSTPGTRAIYVDVDANSVPSTQGIHIHYEATALAAGETGIGIDVEGLTSSSTGGDIQALKVSRSGTGSAEVHAIHVSAGVHVIDQLSGVFTSPTQAWGRDTSLTAWANLTSPDAVGSSAIDSTLFAEVDDYLYIGNTVPFNEIDFVFNTFAGNPGINPTCEFSIAGPAWTAFTPIDNTDGMRQDGGIEWAVADLTSWASVTVNSVASYYIRILRNQGGAATDPIEDRIRISVTTEYQWNNDGDLNINSLTTPLVIGGTETTSDLTLKTTSGVGTSGADMHILVGNNGATEAMTILNNGKVGVGINSPSSALHIKANTPATIGSHPAGQLIIQDPDNNVNGLAVITGYESDGAGNPDQQLWYLGSQTNSDEHVIFLNRRNANLILGTNDTPRMTIDGTGDIAVTGTVDGVDIAALNTDVAGDSATWNATSDALGTAITSTKITNGTIEPIDLNQSSKFKYGAIPYLGDSTVADSAFVTKKYVDDAAGGLTNQAVKGDHVDSTGENFVFDGAYHVTSATEDSAYITIETLEDTAALRGLKAGETWTGVHDYGGATSFELPNSANEEADAAGEVFYDTDDGGFVVYDTVFDADAFMPIRISKEATIFAPDGVNDSIPLCYIDSLMYPHGVTIVKAAIELPADAAYSMIFLVYSNADPPAYGSAIDTVTTGAGDAYKSVITGFDDASVAVGERIYLGIPATDVDWVKAMVVFYANEGD